MIRKVSKKVLDWKCTGKEGEEWDICWTDAVIYPDKLSKMKPWQRINHFMGMYLIANKNNMAHHLNKCMKAFPDEFKFVPKTWVLPAEAYDLRNYLENAKGSPFVICKPHNSC